MHNINRIKYWKVEIKVSLSSRTMTSWQMTNYCDIVTKTENKDHSIKFLDYKLAKITSKKYKDWTALDSIEGMRDSLIRYIIIVVWCRSVMSVPSIFYDVTTLVLLALTARSKWTTIDVCLFHLVLILVSLENNKCNMIGCDV